MPCGASSLAAQPESQAAPLPRPKLADLDDDGQALLRQVIDFYHQNLLASPEAKEWLERRGLNHPELVSHFKLGYAGHHGNRRFSGVIAVQKAVRKASNCVTSYRSGVLRTTTRQDHFRAASWCR